MILCFKIKWCLCLVYCLYELNHGKQLVFYVKVDSIRMFVKNCDKIGCHSNEISGSLNQGGF